MKGVQNMGLTYTKCGDYYLPNLLPPESAQIGKYGRLRESYLKNHRRGLYAGMRNSGKLAPHLENTDREANTMLERLTKQMAKAEGVTESLKAANQMLWVQKMNNIRALAEETVLRELIYD